MDIFSVFTMLGGLALFLYGMDVMGDGLEKQAGSRLKSILERASKTPLRGFLLGAAVTAIIQSSSAATVMVVGFVNSGIMELSQAVGIIMGANVGTTVTAWVLSLSGLQGDSIFVRLLKPSSFSPLLAVVGIILYLFVKDNKKKNVGGILLGFAILMFGMQTMSDAVAPLKDVPEFTRLFVAFKNPVLGVLAGAVLTAIIQSSSASVGILQALSATGAITLRSAVPIIMGQNIGTCVTALLSAVGANKNARRTAMVHLYFNIIGTLLFLVLYSAADALISFSFMDGPADQISIAVVHTAFNLFATAVMLPFGKGLERLANLTIPRQENETEQFLALDERLMEAPSVAIGRCRDITVDMANTARASMLRAMSLLRTYDSEIARQVEEGEQALDRYEDEIGSYLVKLSSRNLSDNDSREVSELLHSIGDFERIGDHATNLLETAQEMNEKHLTFSDEAWEELSHMLRAVQSVLELGVAAFEARDLQAAAGVEPLEDVVDDLKNLLRSRHIDRLKNNICTIEQGFLYSDVLTNCERVADHCSNIAVCLLTSEQESFDPHSYFSETRKQMETYQELYRNYQVQFGL